MTRTLALSVVLLATAASAQPSVEAPLDQVLGATVGTDGLVNYDRLGARYADDLDQALRAIARTDPASLQSDAQKTAFLVNAYNAHILKRVLDRPGATNLERQGLFEAFFETPVRVAGLSMTLNQLENGVLRRQDRVDGAAVPAALRALRPGRLDARVHAALNCAAVSCPPLQRRAFRAATLDGDLERAFQAFVDSPRAARLDGDRVVISSIFDWFASDFGAEGRLGDVLLEQMSGARASAFRRTLAGKTADALRRDRRVRFAYDWTVNRR